MLDEIILNGDWYIVETDETISGELHINKIKKQIWLVLTVLATNENETAKIKACGRTNIIKGKIRTGGIILLYDCCISGQDIENFQKATRVITAKSAFSALDLDRKEDLRFKEVRIDFGEIINWADLCYFDWETKKNYYDEKLEWVHENKVVFEISDDMSLEIVPYLGSKSLKVTKKEMKINQTVYMHLIYKQETHWDEILKDIKILNSLLTLGMNKAIYIDDVSYYPYSHNETHDLIIREEPIFIGDCREGKHDSGNKFEYLFDLKTLTKNDFCCLKNWYAKYNKLKPVIDLYESAFNYNGISAEMLFLNLAQALETYHARFISDSLIQYKEIVNNFLRQKYNLSNQAELTEAAISFREILIAQDSKNKTITLKSRLGYLFLAKCNIQFTFLDYDIKEFIQKTLDSRNYFTHYSPDKEDKIFPERKLPYVNSILIVVLQYYIMEEIGIDTVKIKKILYQQLRAIDHSFKMLN